MVISLIVAMDKKRGIGKNNAIPWRLSTDLKRFKSLTMGHHLIMGRKTFESIGRPLPGRITIILTRNRELQVEGSLVAHSLNEALDLARTGGDSEVFVIGGGEIFQEALPIADRIYLTQVNTDQSCDVYFPEFNHLLWQTSETTIHTADMNNQYPSNYKLLNRLRLSPN